MFRNMLTTHTMVSDISVHQYIEHLPVYIRAAYTLDCRVMLLCCYISTKCYS